MIFMLTFVHSGIGYALPEHFQNRLTFTADPFGQPSSTQYPPTTTVHSSAAGVSEALLPWAKKLLGTDQYAYQIINTALETEGRPSVQPFPTPSVSSIANLTILPTFNVSHASVKPIASSKSNFTIHSWNRRAANKAMVDQTNVFRPMATGAPPSQIPSRADHPVPRLNIVSPRPPSCTPRR